GIARQLASPHPLRHRVRLHVEEGGHLAGPPRRSLSRGFSHASLLGHLRVRTPPAPPGYGSMSIFTLRSPSRRSHGADFTMLSDLGGVGLGRFELPTS